MFEIGIDHPRRIIFVRMAGVLSVAEAQSCAAAKEAAVESLGPPFERHSSLVDIRELRLQAQEIFGIFTDFVANTKHKSLRIAIVAGQGTARMQFRRVAERSPLRADMRYFTDVGAARAWLEDQPEHGVPALTASARQSSLRG